MRIAQTHFDVEQRDIPLTELSEMSEAMIASTTREIVPVVEIDDLIFGDRHVGENTKQLMQLFKVQTHTSPLLT